MLNGKNIRVFHSNDEIKNYILGTSVRESYSSSHFNFELNGVFEKRELNYYFIDTVSGFQREKTLYNVFSVSPVFSIYLIDSIFIPSLFYKLTKYSNLIHLYTALEEMLNLKFLISLVCT